MAKKKAPSSSETALAPAASASNSGAIEFAIARPGESIMETLSANLGGEKLSPFDLDRIKVPAGGGKIWSLPSLEGDVNVPTFDAVIVYTKIVRAYWEDPEATGTPPDCSSEDAIHGRGVGADEKGVDGLCERCPLAQFGSAKDGKGKGQACKMVRQFFIVRTDDRLPMVLACPPSSLKNAKGYLLRLARNGVQYTDVLTRFALSPTKNEAGNPYSRIEFSSVKPLDQAIAAKFREARLALQPTLDRVRAEASDVTGHDGE